MLAMQPEGRNQVCVLNKQLSLSNTRYYKTHTPRKKPTCLLKGHPDISWHIKPTSQCSSYNIFLPFFQGENSVLITVKQASLPPGVKSRQCLYPYMTGPFLPLLGAL